MSETSPKKLYFFSDNDKIKQTIENGSVFLALEHEWFTVNNLLKWLVTATITEQTKIAYKALCMLRHPNEQYLDDGVHFLRKQSDYFDIAMLFDLNPDLPETNTGVDETPLYVYLCDTAVRYNTDKNYKSRINLIVDGRLPRDFSNVDLVTCYQARNFPFLRLSGNEINEALVKADWTAKFRYTEKLPLLILDRIINLQRTAPRYYSEVAYKAYYKVVVKLYTDRLLNQMTKDELKQLDTFFPNIIDQKILKYDNLAYKISLLGNDVAGYILGFPIQNMIPTDAQIHQAIELLIQIGVKEYAERVKAYVKTTYLPHTMFPVTEEIQFANTEDVITEEIDNYVPFDIVAYQVGKHMYRFTRAEFYQLTKSKKNPWTNEWIPPTVLSSIVARTAAAKELGLPPARSLIEFFDRIEKGTLFEGEDSEEDEEDNQMLLRVSPLDFLIAATMGGFNMDRHQIHPASQPHNSTSSPPTPNSSNPSNSSILDDLMQD